MSDSDRDNDKAIQKQAAAMLDAETAADALSLISGLTRGQGAAFEVLTSGGSIAAAARAANVARKTIYEWLKEGHAFGEAYGQWKQSIAETARTRLLMIGEAATVQIARAVRQGDTKAALAVARGMGLLGPPAVGPALTQIKARKAAVEAAKAEAEREERAAREMAFRDLVRVEEVEHGFDERAADEGDEEQE